MRDTGLETVMFCGGSGWSVGERIICVFGQVSTV